MQRQKTLVDVYYEHLNFNPRIVITRHAVERLIERKVSIENFILLLRDISQNLCVRIYECVRRGGTNTNVTGYGIKAPVSFNEDSMKLFIRTVY